MKFSIANFAKALTVSLLLLTSTFSAKDVQAQKGIYLTQAQFNAIKAKINKGEEPWRSSWRAFQSQANSALNARPRSVTDNGAPYYNGPGTANKHLFGMDKKQAGDGIRVEDANREDGSAFDAMSTWIRDLGLAYALTGNDDYARKAIKLIYHWTGDPQTYMKPSADNWGPHQKGFKGGDIGLVAIFRGVTRMLMGYSSLENHSYWSSMPSGAKAAADEWFKAFYREVKAQGTNAYTHNYEARQIEIKMGLAAFYKDGAGVREAVTHWKNHIDEHVNATGNPGKESSRVAGLNYSTVVLMVYGRTAEIARTYDGTNLWGYRTSGRSKPQLELLGDFLAPYIEDSNFPKRWTNDGFSVDDDVYKDRRRYQNTYGSPYELYYARYNKSAYKSVIAAAGRPMKGHDRDEPITVLYASGAGTVPSSPQPPSNTPPVISLVTPSNGDIFTTSDDITIAADATDRDGSVVSVAFYANGNKIGQASQRPFTYNWTGASAGSYDITAKAIDNDGATSPSDPVEITVGSRAGGGVTSPPTASEELVIKKVQARSSQRPNVPENVLDGRSATRWSAKGPSQWIRFELDGHQDVSALAVAWYRGTIRHASFDVEVSTNGSDWRRVYRGQSSGRTADLERVSFRTATAKFVRIVGKGNTENQWNSITEVEIYGREGNSTRVAENAGKASGETTTRTSDSAAEGVERYALGAAYPNPFNPTTTITYRLPEASEVMLTVYNVAGQRVAVLIDKKQEPGTYTARWNGRDATGAFVPSGLYFYRIEAGAFRESRKMLLLK